MLVLRTCTPLSTQLLSEVFLQHALQHMAAGRDALLPVAAELMRGCSPAELLPFAVSLAPVVKRMGGGAEDTDAHCALVEALEAVVSGEDSADRDELIAELLRLELPAILLKVLARDSARTKSQCVNRLRMMSAYGAHAEHVLSLLQEDGTWEAHREQSHELYHQAPTGLLTYHHP